MPIPSHIHSSSTVRPRLFASIVDNAKLPAEKSAINTLSIKHGKSIPINSCESITVGPCESAAERFTSSKDTKEAFQKCIYSVKLKMRITRVNYGPKNLIILEGDALNKTSLASCSGLTEAGLEIKNDSMLNPRLIVHDISVSLSKDEIFNCIAEQNFTNVSEAELKIIYMYPSGNKKFRSCIIEVSPNNRLLLLNRGKINIGWTSCRVEDHLTITQCFNCSGFGHIAKQCKSKQCCCFCAGEHATKDCTNKSALKCNNCSTAKLANVAHSASDKGKCPILRKKLIRKKSFINYGQHDSIVF